MRRESGGSSGRMSRTRCATGRRRDLRAQPLDTGTAIDHLADTFMTDREREANGVNPAMIARSRSHVVEATGRTITSSSSAIRTVAPSTHSSDLGR